MEKLEPTSSWNIGILLLFDSEVTDHWQTSVRKELDQMAKKPDRLHQIVDSSKNQWIDDPNFSSDRHISVIDLVRICSHFTMLV